MLSGPSILTGLIPSATSLPRCGSLCVVVILASGLVGCCDQTLQPPSGDASPLPFDAENGIDLVGQAILIKGNQYTSRPTVQDLRNALGLESSVMQPGNTVLVWDDLGLLAIVPPVANANAQPTSLDPATPVSELAVRYGGQEFTFEPKNSHPYNVRINGLVIGPTTSSSQLTSKGYQQVASVTSSSNGAAKSVMQSAPPFEVFVRFSQQGRAVSEVAIGMEGWPTTPPGPTLPETPTTP